MIYRENKLKGAAVFLYNPCNYPDEIEYFKTIARNCLRRHVITPFQNVQPNKFVIVTHGCRLELDDAVHGQEKEIISFLRVN